LPETLLQWQDGEEHPRTVAFMSRKLKGAQYRYDARNFEALAAQMALQTWRTLLLGQKFEIYSDRDSLQYLFTQKSPPHHHSAFSACVSFFLEDFDFEQIRYVPGAHNVVADLLSRSWDSSEVDVPPAIHFVAAYTSRHTRKRAGPMPVPPVVVLPSWHGSMAVQQKHQRSYLLSVTIEPTETSHGAAFRVVRYLEQDAILTPRMTCVSHTLMAYQCGALNSAVLICQRHLPILASGCLPRTCHLSNDGIDRILRFR